MASVRQRGNRWTALYRDRDGKQKSAGSYDDEDVALAHAVLAEREARPPEPPGPVMLVRDVVRGKQTLAAYAPGWLAAQVLEETSRDTYARTVNRVVRVLGGLPRDEIRPDDVRRLVMALRGDNLRDSTIVRILGIARAMLPPASFEGIRYRVRDQREMMVITREQVGTLADSIDPRFKLFVWISYTAGTRWGETIAIRGTDVSAAPSGGYELRIRRVVIEIKGKCSERPYGKSLRARRNISIPESLARELMAFGPDLVFTDSIGGHLRRNSFRARYWGPAIKRAGFSGLRVHDLRHSAISAWVAAGVPLTDVMRRAGHSSLATTSKYTHALPGDDPFAVLWEEAS